MEERMRNLEKRVESLELAQKTATEADHLQHQQMQLLRTDVQETNSLLKRLLPDVGTSREKLDALERGQQELKQILQQNYDAILEAMVKTVDDGTSDIKLTQGTHSERFDEIKIGVNDIKTTMATKNDIAELKTLMIQLLQQKPPES